MKLSQLFIAGSTESDSHATHARNCGRLILLLLLLALLPSSSHVDFGGYFGLLAIIFLFPFWLVLTFTAIWKKQQLSNELKLQPLVAIAVVVIAWKLQS